MKYLISAIVLTFPVLGATLTVCSGGCSYTSAQAALNASANGDTIVLSAGQNLGSLTIPGGRHDLTIKSSQIDSYPRGYRITRSNPALARLTTVTIGDFADWATTTPGSSVLTNSPGGGGPTPHGLNVGDKVTAGGTRYSAYVCASVNQPPYVDGACDASRVGFINIRTNTGLSTGSILYFSGRTLPVPLVANTPYYVVNFVFGGSVSNADKFQIAATPGGAPITIPQFDPAGQDFIIEVRPLPQAIGDTLYVVATPTSTTLQLSATPDGPPIVWTQIPRGYNGGGNSYGFSLIKSNPVYNLTFDGIEVAPTVDAGIYYPFYVSSAIGTFEGEHHDIRVLRCWIHGADDQEDFPYATLNMAGHDLEVGWSIMENAYGTGNDTQGVAFMSTRNVSIHDNEIKGSAEGIISGGNVPWFAFQANTTGISVLRNYLWKPLKAYIGIQAVYVGPTQFQFISRYGNADCSSVAQNPNLGLRCFAYESQESDPSNPVISRTEWVNSTAASLFTAAGTAGQKGYIYLLGGVFHMDYNYSGSVSCPAGITCTFVATPSFPVLSTRIGIAVIGTGGTFDATFYQQNRNAFSKNLLESKYGDNWLIEGNVFHRQSNCDGGSTCQDPAIQFTVSTNGSGGSDPVNYMVSSSNSIIRNNLFRMLSAGIVGVGKTFAISNGGTGYAWEFGGFGRSIANRVENNLFMDLGSTEYSAIFGGTVVRHQYTEAWTVQHNTAVDVRIGFLADGDKGSIYRSNVVIPYRSACPGGNCTSPSATSEIGVQDQPGPGPLPYFGGTAAGSWFGALGGGNVDSASSFDNNVLMNRNGFVYGVTRGPFYPSTTWMIQPDDPGRDPNTLFMKWQERSNTLPPTGLNYRAANLRLAAGKAALFPSHDNRVIGADLDEIEALTGRSGVDVERGRPKFSDRVARTISAGTTVTALSYLSNGSACTIAVWPDSSYAGTPTVHMNDGGAVTLGGLVSVNLTGLSPATAYYGKRWCGAEVDVFTFNTLATSSTLAVRLRVPGGATSCVVESGDTAALGSVASAVAVQGGFCALTIPSDAAYWRYSYLSAASTLVGRSDILRKGR